MQRKIEEREINISQVNFNKDIYPRRQHDPALVQEYAEILEQIEAEKNYIKLSADYDLLDGRHRQLAYLKKGDGADVTIPVYVYVDVKDNTEKFLLSAELNTGRGRDLSDADISDAVKRAYQIFGIPIKEIAQHFKVRYQTALDYTKAIRQYEQDKENETIFEMYLAGYTHQEIADKIDVSKGTITNRLKNLFNKVPGNPIKQTFETDSDFTPPLYNVWTFAKKTNNTGHFGNSEQRIVDNLLYLYTEPYDIVLDPFAGGGSTIDVCKRRLRRYWVSDRKPIVERENEIRELDIATDLPDFANRWSDVKLTYLDPPYWKQAEGQYSTDPEDLANMPLDKFTDTLTSIVNRIAEKQSSGHIALLIQPTQWKSDNRQFTDHVFDVISRVNSMLLRLKNRVSCPYSTEQYNPQQVNWAKENKELLVLSRELIIWEIVE